jgi:hypothetical protein
MFLSLDTLPQTVGSAQFFVRDLAVILGVAAATTVACHVLRQPVVLGYLIAGVIVGPHFTPALLANEDTLHAISGLGVILILFGLGLEFSFRRMVELGLRPAFIAPSTRPRIRLGSRPTTSACHPRRSRRGSKVDRTQRRRGDRGARR